MKENTIRILNKLITKQSEVLQDLVEKKQKENDLEKYIISYYNNAFISQ